MRLTSILVLALAVFLGVIAVFGVRAMLANNQTTVVQPAAMQETTTVVVARQPFEFGTEIQPEMLREIPWAAQERPQGSFASINEVLNGERRVALRSIAPGELILKDKVSGFGGRATLSQIIEEGKRAITIRVNDVSGAAGFILPSDRVDVLLTINPGGDRLQTYTNILLEDVRVLAIDQVASESQEGAIVAKAATLEVEVEDAQRIVLASTIGSLSLTLRNVLAAAETEEGEKAPNKTIRFRDLGPESSPTVAATGPRPPSPYTSMRVVRGTAASSASVLKDGNSRLRLQSRAAPAQNLAASVSDATGRLSAPAGE